MKCAENEIIRKLQNEAFNKEIKALASLGLRDEVQTRQRNQAVKQASALYRLDPFLDKHGVL